MRDESNTVGHSNLLPSRNAGVLVLTIEDANGLQGVSHVSSVAKARIILGLVELEPTKRNSCSGFRDIF
jgi:hypothetical protein